MSDYDAWLLRGEPGGAGGDVPEPTAEEIRAQQHLRCPVCKADICNADAEGDGRENCPCEGEGCEPIVCIDGELVCSQACRATYEAGE